MASRAKGSSSTMIQFIMLYLKLQNRDFHLLFVPTYNVQDTVILIYAEYWQVRFHVFFKVEAHRLEFRCENSKPAVAVQQGKVGGIGLANIQRRLGLLYPEHYKLEQKDMDIRRMLTIKTMFHRIFHKRNE